MNFTTPFLPRSHVRSMLFLLFCVLLKLVAKPSPSKKLCKNDHVGFRSKVYLFSKHKNKCHTAFFFSFLKSLFIPFSRGVFSYKYLQEFLIPQNHTDDKYHAIKVLNLYKNTLQLNTCLLQIKIHI